MKVRQARRGSGDSGGTGSIRHARCKSNRVRKDYSTRRVSHRTKLSQLKESALVRVVSLLASPDQFHSSRLRLLSRTRAVSCRTSPHLIEHMRLKVDGSGFGVGGTC